MSTRPADSPTVALGKSLGRTLLGTVSGVIAVTTGLSVLGVVVSAVAVPFTSSVYAFTLVNGRPLNLFAYYALVGLFCWQATIQLVVRPEGWFASDDEWRPDSFASRVMAGWFVVVYTTVLIGVPALVATALAGSVSAVAAVVAVGVPVAELVVLRRYGGSPSFVVAVFLYLFTVPLLFVSVLSWYSFGRSPDATKRAWDVVSDAVRDRLDGGGPPVGRGFLTGRCGP
ncbi:MAG: hypothetical protein ABEI99_06195 [Halobaculum sp.]